MFLLLGSTELLAGKGDYTRPLYRVLGGFGLLAISAVMFITVRRWVKWFFGVLGYLVLKTAVSLILGFTPSTPSLFRPRLLFLEFLVVLGIAAALCIRYLTRAPRIIETAALVGLVVALSFSVISDSILPAFVATVVLGIIQLIRGMLRPGARLI